MSDMQHAHAALGVITRFVFGEETSSNERRRRFDVEHFDGPDRDAVAFTLPAPHLPCRAGHCAGVASPLCVARGAET
jgi:hypothetical protein